MKFKVGDMVRVISNNTASGWNDSIELGTTYKVIEIDLNYKGARILIPNSSNPKWWLSDNCLDVAIQPGEQLLFDFMKKEL